MSLLSVPKFLTNLGQPAMYMSNFLLLWDIVLCLCPISIGFGDGRLNLSVPILLFEKLFHARFLMG